MDDFEFEKISTIFENNITFLTMLCLEIKQGDGIQEIVEFCNDAKIKKSFLSGDNLQNTLTGAYKTQIILHCQEIFHLDGDNFDSVCFMIKSMLYKLKKMVKKEMETDDAFDSMQKYESSSQPNFFLLLNCKTFKIILENEYLRTHFLFLLFVSEGVVGYDFGHNEKNKIVKMLNGNVLTIGSAFR